MTHPSEPSHAPQRQLNLFDAICVNVGIIIGAGIYTTSSFVASNVASPVALLGMWLIGGAIALVGALCYGELATRFPRHGGEYVYLTQALGKRLGFLFAWAEFWIIRPGNIGAMAYVFGRYARQIVAPTGGRFDDMLYAAAAIAGLTAINVLGARTSRWTLNLLTVVKVVGLLLICGVALLGPAAPPAPETPVAVVAASDSPNDAPSDASASEPSSPNSSNYRLALILILFTYGGWNEIAYVASEVRDPHKNLWRALVLSTVIVAAIYSLVNLSFVGALGFHAVQTSQAVAADMIQPTLGDVGRSTISLLICLSCLGAINGMVFTGARIPYALGCDHASFAWLGRWSERRGAPIRAMLLQGAVTLALVIGFGLREKAFEQLVNFTAPVFWAFVLLVVVSLFVLRRRPVDSGAMQALTPLYPLTPLAFAAACLFMLYSSVSYAVENRTYEALWVPAVLAVGVVVSQVSSRRESGESGRTR